MRKLLESGLGYTVGNIVIKGITFIFLPIFTHIMTVEDYGKFNIFVSWLNIFTILIGLNLFISLRNAKVDYEKEYEEFRGSIILFSTLIIGGVLLILNYFNNLSWETNLFFITAYALFLVNYRNIVNSNEFKYKQYILISLSLVVFDIIFSIIFIKLKVFKDDYTARMMGYSITYVGIGIYIYIQEFFLGLKNKVKLINIKYWRYAISIAIPLIPHALSQVLLSQADRIMIANYVGIEKASIYSYIYSISLVLMVLWGSIDNIWVPWFFEKFKNKEYIEIKKISNYYMLFLGVISVGLLMLIPEIIKMISPKAYWGGIEIAGPILLSGYFMFLYSFPVNVEYYMKKTKYISLGTIICAITNILLNIIFIKKFGYKAAGYTTLISYILVCILHFAIYIKICKERIFSLRNVFFAGSFILISLAIYVIFLEYFWIRYTYLFIVLLAGFIIIVFELRRRGRK